MKDFLFLFKNRECPQALRRHLLVLVKKTLQFVSLLKLPSRSVILRTRGASIGDLVVIGKVSINGDIRNLRIGPKPRPL